ncbi:MAG: hypothetical protein JNK82_44500 [Myxococcaceae bacterium]|nr:hypothetical protein [Myxococcaceae bacterium]
MPLTTTASLSRAQPSKTKTSAAGPLRPRYGAQAEKELGAIDDFLKRNWQLKATPTDLKYLSVVAALVKKHGLDAGRFRELATPRGKESPERQLTRAAFAYGVLAGERFAVSRAAHEVQMINLLREARGKPPLPELKQVEPLDFGKALEELTTLMSKAGLKAAPSGWATYKKTAREYDPPGPEAKTFKGRQLHFSIGSSAGGFGDSMSRATTYYHHLRGRSPLNTLLSSVFRQGMNLGLETLDQPLRAALERERVAAGVPVV